jgi:two-component system response regulator
MEKWNINPVEILLIEDNPGDVRLTIEALKESKIINNLNIVYDGIEAMEYLTKQGKFKDKPRPELILLDLNLPKKDGREVLAEIKANDKLKRIPVVILTTSEADEDILRTYQLHANCYITKPVNMDQFIKVVKSVGDFWFSIVRLPPDGHND